MKLHRLYSITTILFTAFLSIALFQNCSKPIEEAAVCMDCDGGLSIGSGTADFTISNSVNGPHQSEVDMGKDIYFTAVGIPLNYLNEYLMCTKIYDPMDTSCPGSNVNTPENSDVFSFDSRTNTARFLSPYLPITQTQNNAFSYSWYFGLTFQAAAGEGSDFISKTFYIKPPHLSTNINNVFVWYSTGMDGLHRMHNNGRMKEIIVAPGEPFVSNIYVPAGRELQICILNYSGATPSSNNCGGWANYPDGNQMNDRGRWYNNNPNGFYITNNGPNYVIYVRDKNAAVLDHATTWVKVRE